MLQRHPNKDVSFGPHPGRHEVSDHDLGSALIAGQDWAIAETWRRFAPGIFVLAKRTLGSESEVEDIAQEVFRRVFKKAGTLREPEALRSFVFSFAIRVLKTELRSRSARAWLSFCRPETLVALRTELIDVESRDLLRRFYALLNRLSPRSRLVFALRHLESMTLEEVAVHMQLSLSTVKRALSRATDQLSCWIEADAGLVCVLEEGGWRRATSTC